MLHTGSQLKMVLLAFLRIFGNVCRCFLLSQLDRGATHISREKARDSREHSTEHTAAAMTSNCLVQNVNSAVAENPWASSCVMTCDAQVTAMRMAGFQAAVRDSWDGHCASTASTSPLCEVVARCFSASGLSLKHLCRRCWGLFRH